MANSPKTVCARWCPGFSRPCWCPGRLKAVHQHLPLNNPGQAFRTLSHSVGIPLNRPSLFQYAPCVNLRHSTNQL